MPSKPKQKIQYRVSEPKKFTIEDQGALTPKEALEKNGFAIVPGVLSGEQSSIFRAKFWDWLEAFKTGINRNDPSTWNSKTFPANIHGIFQHYAIGHADFIWEIRQLEAIIKLFADIYGDPDLLVSFDGANLSYPSNVERKSPPQDWYHVDQSFITHGLHCVQGLVNLNQNGISDGGLTIIKESQKFHEEFFQRFPDRKSPKDNFVRITNQQEADYLVKEKKLEIVKPCGNPGDIFLWDSKVFHQASRPSGTRYRAAIYVSYEPRKRATAKALEQKRKWFNSKRMTSHWSATLIKPFAKHPQVYGDLTKLTKFPVDYTTLPILSKVGRRLAGFDE
jgi:hypothetical protein